MAMKNLSGIRSHRNTHKKNSRSPYAAMHTGPGRALVAVYGIFALAASVRAGYQLGTKFDTAPLPYTLSAIAAAVYILATVFFVIGNRSTHRLAIAACLFEFIGVITVGVLSVTHPEIFADASVWSRFGQGYGYIPLVLPLVGLWWLFRIGRPRRQHKPV